MVAGVLCERADGDRVRAPQLHRYQPGIHQLQAGEELVQRRHGAQVVGVHPAAGERVGGLAHRGVAGVGAVSDTGRRT